MSERENIAAILAKGKKRFVLVNGVLGWGLMTGILVILIRYFRGGAPMGASDVIVPLIIFPIGGILWGLAMWAFFQWRMRKLSENDKS